MILAITHNCIPAIVCSQHTWLVNRNRLCCYRSSHTFPITDMFVVYHTHLVKLNHFCSLGSTQTVHASELYAVYHYKKRHTSVPFWAERKKFLSCLWHFYHDNCDKTRYHHRCGGLLLLRQKIMTKNGLFVLGGLETHLHDILSTVWWWYRPRVGS